MTAAASAPARRPVATATVADLLESCSPPATTAGDRLLAARSHAGDWATSRGLPTRKDEDWKYTPLEPLIEAAVVRRDPNPAEPVDPNDVHQDFLDAPLCRLVFVNGLLDSDLSFFADLPAGMTVKPLALELARTDTEVEDYLSPSSSEFSNSFEAINAATTEDGAVIRVEPGLHVGGLIELFYWSDSRGPSAITQPRSIIVAGDNSNVSVVERYTGPAGASGLTNAVTRVIVGEGATVEHYKIQDEPDDAFHLGLLDVVQSAGSRFSSVSFALGSQIARHEVRIHLIGERADSSINGLYLPGGERHHDNPVLVVHVAPNCTSRQLYKGIVTDRGHGIFNGHLVVLPGADGTDAGQTNKNLLLSDHAEVDTRPRLEILTDDVKCTHGATVGALDPDALFYLRSRGIPAEQAKTILTNAFAGEVLDLVADPGLRTLVERLVDQVLSGNPMKPVLT